MKLSVLVRAFAVASVALFSPLSQSASAAPGDALVTPDANDLLAGASTLDTRAGSHEAQARSLAEAAEVLLARARDMRADAARDGSKRASLLALASDNEVRAEQRRGEAARARREAESLRARAEDLRKRARALAGSAAQPKRARLDVMARSRCDLVLDGVPRGSAPILGLQIRAGTHEVSCTTEGHPTRTRRVAATDGQVARVSFEDAAPVDPTHFL